MSDKPRWGVGSNQYKKRPGKDKPSFLKEPDARLLHPAGPGQSAATGFAWNSAAVDWDALPPMPVERALARFKGQLAGHVWDAAALEGNPYTLPEVQTLLDGVTVGGHRVEDAEQVLALGESTRRLHGMVRDNTFEVSKGVSDTLHGIVAAHEAIEAGHFRGEGSVRGGGTVNLGEYGTFQATSSDDGGEALRAEYRDGVGYLTSLSHPVERAVAHFCLGTRRQFYFDGNKRTSRLMMNGILMQSGFDAISIPFARRLELNQHLLGLYRHAEATSLMQFIIDCRPKG